MQTDFLSYLPPLPLPHEMHQWDRAAIALGLPEILLMENAAQAALSVMYKLFSPMHGKKIWLFMGSGNNGGDAACLARLLLDIGARPLVWHTKPLGKYTGATGKHLRLAKAADVVFEPLTRLAWPPAPEDLPNIVVDGLLGTGFRGSLRPQLLETIQRINSLPDNIPVFSLDIPSGLDGLTGRPMPDAIRATHTVSFAAAKPGLMQPAARPWTGQVHVRSIGIPQKVRSKAPCSAFLLDRHCLDTLPQYRPDGHKNSYGHLLVLGGASGMGGAAQLTARAALRSGVGLVTATAAAAAIADIKGQIPEIMTLALPLPPGRNQYWPTALPDSLIQKLPNFTAVVAGPGMGRQEGAAILEQLLSLPERPPLVLDADALILASKHPAILAALQSQDIITPHPGEAAVLLGINATEVQDDRLSSLKALCNLSKAAVVLKGAGSLVGQTDYPWLLSPHDVPTLSVAGSGDVLAGCLGALLAQMATTGKVNAFQTAALGVSLHCLAGLHCARNGKRGQLASELADALARVWPQEAANMNHKNRFSEELPWIPFV